MIKLVAALLFAASVGFLRGFFFLTTAAGSPIGWRIKVGLTVGFAWSILAAVPVFFAFLFGDL